ncbi:methyltransferase domain-containing protein [Phytoactinopolyspora halotolerans]|uniref:Methyltransferase domain-containing protein n=1 Tax=Phytoactinopolyspora halotolerans TaxID=1981512 RepID=A0A6L9SDD1_9ACTN|nr:methyltransferase domain-containing protein [Phytoactinopolyspora halotolerans]NEE03079.1 methyltransferase domain-containing protein [Phytoactinopolyspora halotolerans]
MTDHSHRGVRGSAVWEQVSGVVARRTSALGRAGLDIVDVGGGSGIFAVPLAADGHRVTVVDPSPNALATLRQRASEAQVTDLVAAVQGDAAGLGALVGKESADLVLCHGVLEVVDEPSSALAGIAECLRPGALASIVVAQRNAAVISKAVAGHLHEARRLLDDPDGRWGPTDPLPRRFREAELRAVLAETGFTIEEIHGVRIFTDLVPGALVDEPADVRALAALEAAAAGVPEMRAMAAVLHVIAARP